jgi:predicted HD superfamily hydrolase involved in NAD metabolism
MNNSYIESLRKDVKRALKSDKMRFRHTIGVADTSACLASRYGVDMQKAYISGLLHDCAKCVPDEQKITECEQNNIEITKSEYESPYLLHSKLGAFYADVKYGIKDEDILGAIKWHTTGHPDMTMLEKIVFVADYIEPYRNKAANLDTIRYLAFTDIDKAVLQILNDTINYLNKKFFIIQSIVGYISSNRISNKRRNIVTCRRFITDKC